MTAFIVLTLIQLLSAADARAQVTHTVIAATGDTAPAGGNYVNFFSTPATNLRGEVAFDAFLSGPSTSGVFVSRGTNTSAFALGGNPDPAAGNFPFTFAPFLTTRGDLIFITDTGFFRGNGRSAVPLVQNGDLAPGGGTQQLGTYAANAGGAIAYLANLTGGIGTQGIFRTDGSRTAAIVFDTTVPPTGGAFFLLGEPVMDDRGRVAFFAGMSGGSADFAILRGDGETLTTIFAANQPAPGGGTFQDFGTPHINKHGQVLSLASLNNATGPTGLFLGDGQDSVAIAVSGQAAPKGGNYCRPGDVGCPGAVQFAGTPSLNNGGQAAFDVFLTGGTSRSGIFRGNGTETTPIALQGTAAPGTTGTFASFADLTLGDDGRVVFIANLTLGVGGVDTTNNTGIWVGTSETDLRLVARSGQIMDGRTLMRPDALAPLQVSSNSVVWRGRFSGRSTAIISSYVGDDSSLDRATTVLRR
jgi:hypothetical protein